MEIMLLILAATYAVSGKHHKDTAQSAYKAGHEPPGLAKARMRHEAGGGKFASRPGKKDKPKGPGAARLLIAQRWAGACEKARTKGEDKLRRWHAWYQEQAPQRDEAWRAKQRKKMANRANRLAKWQGRWQATKNAAGAAAGTMTGRGRGEQDTTGQIPGTGQDSAETTDQAGETTSQTADPPAEPAASEEPQNQPALHDQAGQAGTSTQDTETGENTEGTDQSAEDSDSSNDTSPAENTGQGTGGTAAAGTAPTTTTGGIVDYKTAAAALYANAERVEQYRSELTTLADALGGKHWGEEVHGPLRDMDGALQETAADYRDQAAEMEQAGDAIRDAEDAHPYVPGQEVVNA